MNTTKVLREERDEAREEASKWEKKYLDKLRSETNLKNRIKELEARNGTLEETLNRFLKVIKEECIEKHLLSLDDPTVNENYHVELTFQVKELQELNALMEALQEQKEDKK